MDDPVSLPNKTHILMNEKSYTDIFYKVYRIYQFILMFHAMKDSMKKMRLTECYIYHHVTVAAAKLLQSYPTLCNPIDGSPSGSSVPGILQARILEWVAISFSNACSPAKSLQSCPTLCDPTDSSPPGSSVHGILQATLQKFSTGVGCHFLLQASPLAGENLPGCHGLSLWELLTSLFLVSFCFPTICLGIDFFIVILLGDHFDF